MTHFIAVDGEGITYDDDRHDYVLLSVGDQSLHKNGERLTFHDIMPFLYRQHQLNPRAAFVGFYLGYDFSQWLRDLSEDAAWFLLDPEGIKRRMRKVRTGSHAPFPVRFAGWEFDLLQGKRFKLRPAVQTDTPWSQENVWSWMWVCDAGPFWQSSFLTAVNPANWTTQGVCTEHEWETITEGKARRSDAGFDPAMIEYNVTENRVMARAMTELDRGFRSQGWRMGKQQWFGPGQTVSKWLGQVQAPTREQVEAVTPAGAIRAAQAAYYGGWFEITRHGHVPGDVWEYDINSAYPHVIRNLPCLLHGEWRHGSVEGWSLVHVTTTGSDPYLGGLPHRDRDGVISRPQSVTGWYWRHEVAAAVRAGLIGRYVVRDVWSYIPCDCAPPLASIESLYAHRLEVGKNTAYGKADKLVYNSAYGKMAQSVGNPRYANAVYASLITAGCRTMILDAIATHPTGSQDVIMVATDGVYFRSRHPGLDVDPGRLGAWDETVRSNMTLFMPGVYWDDETRKSLCSGQVKVKSRGVRPDDLAANIEQVDVAFTRAAKRFTGWPEFEVPIRFQVTSPALAMHRGNWSSCGAVSTRDVKRLSSDPVNKRESVPRFEDGCLVTSPYADKGTSVAYSSAFGHDTILGEPTEGDSGGLDRDVYEYLTGVE